MDIAAFESTLYKNWTGYFGCPVETAQQIGTTLIRENKYDGDQLIVLSHIGRHTFVQFDPVYESQLIELVGSLPANTSLTGDLIQRAWGDESIVSRDVFPAYYLFPPDLPDFSPPSPFQVRPLTETDAEAMSALHEANTPEEVDDGYVELTHQAVFGCFLDERLVSAASGYEWKGFLDLGVLTHPDFRQKRLGKAVVGSLCNWANQHGIIAQYRHNVLNIASQGIARSLNFRMYFKSETVSLR